MNHLEFVVQGIVLIAIGIYGLRFKEGKINLSPEKEALREKRLSSKNVPHLLSVLSIIAIFGGVILLIIAIWSVVLKSIN